MILIPIRINDKKFTNVAHSRNLFYLPHGRRLEGFQQQNIVNSHDITNAQEINHFCYYIGYM